jgi:hypothetical protein
LKKRKDFCIRKKGDQMLKKLNIAIINCLTILLFAGCLSAAACDRYETGANVAERGFVKGTVRDSAGNPLEGVKIIVDHSIFYNSNISTTTDASGNYRVKVRTGSWYVFAQLRKTYNGKNYNFYLEPDKFDGFGGEGAIRNFVWKLTGEKQEPLSRGFFGGLMTFDKAIGGEIIEDKEIEFTLKPVGNLIDGSAGKTLRIRSSDGHKLEDIPIGRYDVSASYRGRSVRLRKWNTSDEYVKALQIDFEPQIPAQCDNCIKLEYKY